MTQKNKNKIKNGFTLIESLVFLFIFTTTVFTFYTTFTLGLNFILETKLRLAAVGLANEKMEIIRSLKYETVGTTGSIDVPGNIVHEEDIIRSGRSFKVKTQIGYVDDDFDGLVILGTDERPNDYKKVLVIVSWDTTNASKSVSMTGTFAAPGIEPPLSGGIMSLNILDSEGNGISGATINIVNNATVPNINDAKTTGLDGNYLAIGAPQSNQGYKLEVSKSGYYTARTYPPYSGAPLSFNPIDIHASVINGALTTKTIIIDRLSNINLHTKDIFGNDIADIEFDIEGGRRIGEDITTMPITNIYDFKQASLNTDSAGKKEFSDRSSGIYFFTYKSNLPDYEFLGMNPGLMAPGEFDVPAGQTIDVDAVFADKNINSLFVKVVDSGGSPIEGAQVQLKNAILSFDITRASDSSGFVYYPTSMPELVAGQYELKITAAGYADGNSTVDINNLVIEEVVLAAS